ncbi:MAG: hypothetical protein M1823_001831 [Watsoniomyces obsoletus]|nr:MAG: hypothetical protein M1823_001831 [Watsoniomyces obsoletus]
MLREIVLEGYPSSSSALSWSEDGDLAVALGEHVHVMIPSVTLLESASDPDSDWDLVRIRVNDFTSDEFAYPKPASFAIFSIGEEVSDFEATSIAWSPAGLAKHGRAALAVLTANHVLSVWDPTANPREEVNWKRALIVNHAMKNQLFERWPLEPDGNLDGREMRRLRRRIRAYAWSHACRLGPDDRWGVPLLVVANDYHEMVITRARSPYNGLTQSSEDWDLEILARIDLKDDLNISAGRPSRWRAALSGLRFASNVAWSPWYGDPENGHIALLAYCFRDRIHVKKVLVRREGAAAGGSASRSSLTVTVGRDELDLLAPGCSPNVQLVWHDQVYRGSMYLALATPAVVCIITVNTELADNSQRQEPSINERGNDSAKYTMRRFQLDTWDPIAGLSFYSNELGELRLYCVTHLSKARTFDCFSSTVEVDTRPSQAPNRGMHDLGWPWQKYDDTLTQHRSAFGSEFEMGVVSQAKSSAMVCSTLGYTAIAFSIHPKDIVEYITPGNERSTIMFIPTHAKETENGVADILEDPNASSEAKIFRIAYMAISASGLYPRQQVREHLKSLVERYDREMASDDQVAPGSALGQPLKGCHTWPMLASILPRALFREHHARSLQQMILLSALLSVRPEYTTESESDSGSSSTSDSDSSSDSDETVPDVLYELPPGDTISPLTMRSVAMRHFAAAILQVPHQLVSEPASKTLLYVHACAALQLASSDLHRLLELSESALQWLQDTNKLNLDAELEYCQAKLSDMTKEREWPQPVREETAQAGCKTDIIERCSFCGQRLGWVGQSEARCTNGHTFVRCSLTLLAIQAPGHSRHCGVCGRIFLTDAAFEHNDEQSDRRPSLPQLLIAACDVCAFCGGKFAG